MLGYHLGYGIGGKTFELNQSRYFKPEHIEKTRQFFEKYGNISVLLARFLPLRGCVSFLAGATRMPYRTFMIYNVLGAVIWAAFLPLAGYYLGKIVPIEDLEKMFLVPVISVIVMLIVVPTLVHIYRDKKKQKKDDTTL
jgi:membrane-associated protein